MENNKFKAIYYSLNTLFRLYSGFIGATFIVFFYSCGFNEVTTNIIVSTSLITIFFAEIPTGAISDVFGRRFAVIASGVMLLFANIIFLFGNHYYLFILAQIFVGIAYAFFSGSLDSWMVEHIKLDKINLDHVFIVKNKWVNGGVIVGGLIGGVLSDINPRSIFLLSIVSSLVYIVIAYRNITDREVETEPWITQDTSVVKDKIIRGFLSMASTIRYSYNFVVHDKMARSIVLFNSALTFCFSAIFVFWQPILFDYMNQSDYYLLGIAWVFMQSSMFLGTLLSHKLIKWFKNSRFAVLYGVTFLIGIVIVVGVKIGGFWAIGITLIIFEVGIGVLTPLKEASLNYFVEDEKKRATILSFQSMFIYIFNYFSMILMGFLSTRFTKLTTWVISGLLLIILSILYGVRINNTNKAFQLKVSNDALDLNDI